jgi:hypothetical protein
MYLPIGVFDVLNVAPKAADLDVLNVAPKAADLQALASALTVLWRVVCAPVLDRCRRRRRDVDDRGALPDPLLRGHRSIADDVLADRGLNLPGVAPALRIALLQPEDLRSDVGRHVLDDRHARHLAVLVAEDLLGVERVADSAGQRARFYFG